MAKGKMILIGGAEDKGIPDGEIHDSDIAVDDYYRTGILKRIIDESAKKEKSRIEILTTASLEGKSLGTDYKKAFGLLKAKNTDVMNITSREQAQDEGLLKRLAAADVLMVTGGDQMRLTSILGGTPFLKLLHEKYQGEDFIYAGSSAGAAAASNNMVFQGDRETSLYKGKVKVTSGLGFLNHVLIDTHFVTRGRIGRLLQIVVANPRLLGIGLEENAAIMIKGKKMKAIGPGMVIIIDGRDIRDTNFNDIYDGEAISVENVVLHVMSKDDMYDLKDYKLTINHTCAGE